MTFSRYAVGLGLVALSFAASAQQAPRKSYIIQMADAPAASYEGGISGMPATRPARGAKLQVNAGDVQNYLRYLDTKAAALAATVPSAQVFHRYGVVFNGFAAKLTDAELNKLRLNPSVKAITVDEAMALDTSYTPSFLGLNTAGGFWSKTDANGRKLKGEDVIIANVDTGVWPESPSFSDKVDTVTGKPVSYTQPGTVVYDPLPAGRYKGSCMAGPGFTAAMCNNKLIGAQYFSAGFAATGYTPWNTEYASPRDEDGHGSHTLSTAGGNEGSSGNVQGTLIPAFSGIAPRARLAAYKVCQAYVGVTAPNVGLRVNSCFTSDSIAAINKAVADGVDVINYSISGSQTSFLDAVEQAFKAASAAGVFVAASAGNSHNSQSGGTTPQVAHISPWLMTVGNSTHDRYTEAAVTLHGAPGNGYIATGPSFQLAGLPSAPLILSTDAGFTGATYTAAQLTQLKQCFGGADGLASPLLDPTKVGGKILVCYRGGNAFVNKANNAKAAGAVGYIAQNVAINLPASLNTLFVVAASIPMVHLSTVHEAQIFAHAAVGGTASFAGGVQVAGIVAPVMSGSSSRGPNKGDANVLKPDITAPGTDIIAAYTDSSITATQRDEIVAGTRVPGPGANMISGTSMSSPHIAGAAALMKQANPTWSPAAIKSALMTSAQSTVRLANGNTDSGSPWANNALTNTGPFGYGAGHVNPNGALASTLVYDLGPADYAAYESGAISPWNLNLPSITRANVLGVATVTRTLKNTGASSVTYSSSGNVAGYTVTTSPASLTIPAGGSASYTATITRTTAALETWAFGELVWTGDGKTVRSPVQVKGSSIAATSLVTDNRNIGTKVYTVGTGFSGPLLTSATGLVPATRFSGRSVLGQPNVCTPAFTVPAGAQLLRVQLFNADTDGGAASDIDLLVYRGATLVGSSGNGDSNELVQLSNPTAATTYTACVNAYAPAGGAANFVLSTWVVGPAAGVQTLRAFGPSTAYLGGTASIGLSWNVPAGARYLGNVQYRNVAAGAVQGSTTVFIDNAPVVPTVTAAPLLRIKPEMPLE